MNYADYLKTEHWKQKRIKKLLKNPNCQICQQQKGLNIHHKKYQYNNKSILFNERLEDLITLCRSCHRLMHYHFGIDVYKINKKILRIKRLLDLGVPKKRAFYFSTQNGLFNRIRDYMVL